MPESRSVRSHGLHTSVSGAVWRARRAPYRLHALTVWSHTRSGIELAEADGVAAVGERMVIAARPAVLGRSLRRPRAAGQQG
jgi:hypothetical protein